MDLTVRQEEALEQLKRIPVPPAPAIPRGSLIPAPAWYRWAPNMGWAPVGGVLLAAALIGLVFVRLPLTEGGSHWAISEGLQTVRLPLGKTTLILQSPADLQVRRLERHLLSGRLEADLLLRNGDLFLEVDSRAPRQIFIQTPLLQARITGTRLLIGHRPEQGSRLTVLRGEARVRPASGAVAAGRPVSGGWSRLPAGEELTVRTDGTVLRQPIQSAFDPAQLQPRAPAAASDSAPTSLNDSTTLPAAAAAQAGPLRRLIWREEE